MHIRRDALIAHRTQVAPDSFWFKVPDQILEQEFPWEDFVLGRSLVDSHVPEGRFEHDLFAGIREGT